VEDVRRRKPFGWSAGVEGGVRGQWARDWSLKGVEWG
jgi:hypothetical protein